MSDHQLGLAAAFLSDIESVRIATENRVRSMTEEGDIRTALADRLQMHAETLLAVEHAATLDLQREMRRHPLGPWVKGRVGIGLKQGARMLAAIGDPYMRPAMFDEDDNEVEPERPRRGPGELWQYAGHGDPARSQRRKGQRVQFSPEAKMRVHLVAESCIKQAHSPYRPVYDAARASWADREVSDGHKHNHGLRLVGKAILKDLFLEARALATGVEDEQRVAA